MLVLMLNLLYVHISTFRSVCAVTNMDVFCSSLILCFPDMWLGYFLNDFYMVPVAPVITGIITFVFTFHMRFISSVMSNCILFSAFCWSYFCLPKLHQLKCMFLFHCRGLWCPVYCWGWFYWFACVYSIIWSPYLLYFFLLILVHVYTNVFM
jgi:hypothetical protein